MKRVLKIVTQCRNLTQLENASYNCPEVSKFKKGGEDALFMHERFLGIADGVGGWHNEGIDSGLHSRELLYHVQKELGLPVNLSDIGEYYRLALERSLSLRNYKTILPCESHTYVDHHPLDILKNANKKVKSYGASTCCLLFLNGTNGRATALNLGDCGYVVLRGNDLTIEARSKPQLHCHNMPFQLGHMSSDQPHHGEVKTIDLKRNDWIVMGTDGVWDNLYLEQIQKILENCSSPLEAAREIGDEALHYCMDVGWESPYSRNEKLHQIRLLANQLKTGNIEDITETTVDTVLEALQKHTGITDIITRIRNIRGGKPDDISVIVSRVI